MKLQCLKIVYVGFNYSKARLNDKEWFAQNLR